MGSVEEEKEISQFLSTHPDFLRDWILNQADQKILHDLSEVLQGACEKSDENSSSEHRSHHFRLPLVTHDDDSGDDSDTLSCAPSPSVVPRTGRKSVTSDLFHQWLSATPRSPGASTGGVTFSANPPTVISDTADTNDINTATNDNTPPSGNSGEKNLEILDPNDRLIELILDISNELDINVLCHKILLNVGYLTQADKCSLFLARGPRDKRYLEAKLFDVDASTSLEEALQRASRERIHIPFGVGICGHVAQTKETINLRNAYEDPRFNRLIDGKTGYKTDSLVCMPVCNYDGEVIGVAQIINKRGGEGDDNQFTEKDLKVFQRYLTFCGIGLQNAQLFEVSILEYKKNQLLLSLARSLFQEQMSLERLVTTIIREAKDLLKCERCTVYLLDLKMYDAINNPKTFLELVGPGNESGLTANTNSILSMPNQEEINTSSSEMAFINDDKACLSEMSSSMMMNEDTESNGSGSQVECSGGFSNRPDSGITFQRVWELTEESDEVHVFGPNDKDLQKSRRARIAKYVATTNEVLNLSSVAAWLGENLEDRDGFVPKTMLCLPIFNGQRDVIGVAQLINKKHGTAFGESDIVLFEAFAIFCGIGIHNTKMYEGACKLMAKQKVALDCLSYHAAANDQDTEILAKAKIPPAESYQLYSFKFIDAEMGDEETFKITLRMFLEFDLITQFQIPYKVLCRWILSVKKNYRPVKYHNWRHALNVCQTMFTVLKTGKLDRFMNDLEIFGLLVACLCHDLDHRGTNNAFESKVESPLAILYSTSTMEHHHFDQCVMILNSEGNNIFQGLGTSDYKTVMRVVEQAILATDLALYFKRKDQFLETANKGEIDWQEQNKKDLLCGMLMTASDVSAIAKPWEIQHKLAKRVADEFFDQGDMEKLRLNTQPIAMMDRERKDELPQMQVEFIDVVCKPLYSSLSESFPWIKPLLDGCLSNREKWADLAEKVEMGLTWIDYDTIEKPIEEITVGTGEAKDIEFTVETLKCNSELKKQGNGLTKKRSFRAAKSPLRSGYHHGGTKGGSFFHRRLSTKSPNRGTACLSATEISLDDRRSSNIETTSATTGDSPTATSPDLSKVKMSCNKSSPSPSLPRSTSQPQRVTHASTISTSCDTVASATSTTTTTRGRSIRRSQLGQSMSVDYDETVTSPGGSLPPPEIVISGRDEQLPICEDQQVQRKGSASSEGSCGGRKSPRERLVYKMTRVFR